MTSAAAAPASAPKLTSVATGLGSGCGIDGDSAVWCWGLNVSGGVGDGTTVERRSPRRVVGLPAATSVSVGDGDACAVMLDGTVRCWGWNDRGELGDGTTLQSARPVVVAGLTDVESLVSGETFTCALLHVGTARCWGRGTEGQLGDGGSVDRAAPVTVSGLDHAVQLVAGWGGVCARRSDGTVACWGQAGFDPDGKPGYWHTAVPFELTAVSDVSWLALGGTHACAVITGGLVRCWGANDYGQLGDGTTTSRTGPVTVTGLTGVVEVSSGDRHSCAVLAGGSVWCWGLGDVFQLGTQYWDPGFSKVPVAVPGVTMAVHITSGEDRSCAVLSGGGVTCWGHNAYGALGIGSFHSGSEPADVSLAGQDLVSVEAGDQHSCALARSGRAWCWGRGDRGQLGTTSVGDRVRPTPVVGLRDATDLAAGRLHTCARRTDGTLWCWGANDHGQLGDGSTTDRSHPVQVSGLAGVLSLAAGGDHTCARTREAIWCWGDNDHGELGDGTATDRSAPVAVVGLPAFTQLNDQLSLALGSHHTCAAIRGTSDDTFCWGADDHDQLGLDATGTADRPVPVQARASRDTSLAAGGGHTCLGLYGDQRCWGANDRGQLGDGTTVGRAQPEHGLWPGGWTTVTAGRDHTCQASSPGVLRCAGANERGQLGDGTTSDRSTPVLVTDLGPVGSFTAGDAHTCAIEAGALRCWGANDRGQLGDGTTTDRLTPGPVSPALVEPGAPALTSVVPGSGQATVSWTPPASDGGSPITGYVVTPSIGSVEQAPRSFASTATTQAVTGLVNGTTYRFTVAAVSDIGQGDASELSPPVTAGTPTAPSITRATPGNGSVSLTWSAPSSAGGAGISGYVVTPSIGSVAQAPVAFASTATTQTISGLANGTTYTFVVAATNSRGTGAPSLPSAASAAGAPGLPGFQGAAPGNGSAKVAWTASAANGQPVTGYVVTPYVGPTAQPSTTFTSAATTQTVTGLTNGTSYTFAVAGINANGTGPAAVTAPIVVGTPTAPVFPRAVPGTTTAKVAWNASTPNAAPITSYAVTPYIGSAALPTQTFAGAPTTVTVTGLTSGVTYSFKVTATNSVGAGPAAQTSTFIEGSPAQPGFVSASATDGGARIQFTVPAANSAPITGYTVWPVLGSTVLAPQAFATPSATAVTLTSLANASSYTFRIAATSSVGTGPYATTNAVSPGTPTAPPFPSAAPGDGSARVAWLASAANGAAITGYTVVPYSGSIAGTAQSFGPTATSGTMTGLANATTYTFKVYATNARGTGLANATAAVKVGTPTTPVFPGAAPLDASARVTWAAATANGSPITGYVVTPIRGATVLPSITVGAVSSYVVTGLVNGQTYTFRVAAINARGTGPFATTSAVAVGTPSAPIAVKATTGVGQASVTWTAPSGNGSALTGYLVIPYLGGTALPPRSFDATATSRIITGLAPGGYTFKVQAINARGSSALSSASASVVVT